MFVEMQGPEKTLADALNAYQRGEKDDRTVLALMRSLGFSDRTAHNWLAEVALATWKFTR